MSYENAKANLKELGKELGVELQFDENQNCIIDAEIISARILHEQNQVHRLRSGRSKKPNFERGLFNTKSPRCREN